MLLRKHEKTGERSLGQAAIGLWDMESVIHTCLGEAVLGKTLSLKTLQILKVTRYGQILS